MNNNNEQISFENVESISDYIMLDSKRYDNK